MRVMTVVEAENKVVFTVSSEGKELRALQLVDRTGGKLYANTEIEVGDIVLVVEVPAILLAPNMSASETGESISHIIVGIIPPSKVHEISDYSNLVKGL